MRHVSIRVPWHDQGWNGTVCLDPRHNAACLKLVNISEKKDESAEALVAGRHFKDISAEETPPCLRERVAFMSPFGFQRYHEHPYRRTSEDSHGHFAPTLLRYPAYSAPGLPFRWMNKREVFGDPKRGTRGLADQYPLDALDAAVEPDLGFDTNWIQDHRNQRELLDCFWAHVKTEDSLVFFYAKQVPLIEDTPGRRVLIGVGRVKSIGDFTEYSYDPPSVPPPGKLRSLMWECMVGHSIRPGSEDGFLLPYQEALVKSKDGTLFDPAEVVALSPEDRFTEFSYATEHVSDDAAISALLSMKAALERCAELFGASTRKQEAWIDREVGRLWHQRGAFPGLGPVLSATGVHMGNFVAAALREKVGEQGSPWEAWFAALQNPPAHLPAELARHIDSDIAKSWQRMPGERRAFLELLSRIDLTQDQGDIIAVPEERKQLGIELEDADFIKNPYLLYEATRLTLPPIAIGAVDRGLFPAASVRQKFPIPEPSRVETAVDSRRLRALSIRELEGAATQGDTVRAREDIVTALRRRDQTEDEQRTPVTGDLLAVAEADRFAGEIRVVSMADGKPAYQLERLGKAGDLIRLTVDRRVKAKRHEVRVDWRKELDGTLGKMPMDPIEAEKEERARTEKAAALAEIAAARFSVLIGSAGTGKTMLLSVLCKHSEMSSGGILLLAPTGKARVRMEDVAKRAGIKNLRAYTLAQFLGRTGRYDRSTQRYLLTGKPAEKGDRTVIVDECSMLTEEMLAALLEALTGVYRLILVGDHRQLPPIGAGRPFVDIINRLKPAQFSSPFPKMGPSYAELTVPRRQEAGDRDDLELASWFGGETGPGDDRVFEVLSGQRKSETIKFVQWETPDELESKLPAVLAETLGFEDGLQEWQAFAKSLGGQVSNGYVYFNRGRSGAAAEAWQILSPVRQKPWGVEPLNRLIHRRYKAHQIEDSVNVPRFQKRRFLKPQGDQQIVYGDKVLNNTNTSLPRWRLYPEAQEGYLANGEIGIVVGQMRTRNFDYEPKNLEIEFSTQQGSVVKFFPGQFDEDKGDANLELAYVLTVHKAQGSEFETVFLILPKSSLALTRELIYTALTRQKKQVVVLLQGSAVDLQRLSGEHYSGTAARLTNLFGPPKPVLVGKRFLEDGLIHRTARGEAVRSKSEVIIANLLHDKGIDYHYEQPLEINGVAKYPDFTIEDDDTGETYYWEHLGMLHDRDYRDRWEEKRAWLKEHGILPREEGKGQRGTLLWTQDSMNGGIDSEAVARLIHEVFGV
jgi:ATP-dependent exoDNAse (exonuclease V) alpha subunit